MDNIAFNEASSFIIDDFNGDPSNGNSRSVVDDTTGDGGASEPSPIDPGNTVMNILGGGTWSRELYAELLSGEEKVTTAICYGCQEGHAFSDPGAEGDFEWRYTGSPFDASEFDYFMIDYFIEEPEPFQPGGVVELYFDGELAAQSNPLPAADSSLMLPLLISDNSVSNVTIRVDGVEGLNASPDNAKLVTEAEDPNFGPDFGTIDGDEIEVEGSKQLVFAGSGNDLIDASTGEGNNRLYTSSGDDTLILGSGDRIIAGAGDDAIFTTSGGDNIITGGAGADQFWIASAEIPDGINQITDFTSGEDVIGIAGLGIIGFEDVSLTQQGDDALIGATGSDLAILENVDITSLSGDDFAFS